MTLARLVHDEDYPNRQDVLDMLSQFIRAQPLRMMEEEERIDPLSEVALKAVIGEDLDEQLSFDLSGAQLVGASLREQRLINLVLRDTNLTKVKLFASKISGTDFTNADLSGAMLTGAHFTRSVLEKADLSGAALMGVHLSETSLLRANLAGAHLDGAHFKNVLLASANLQNANLAGANLIGAKHVTQVQLDQAIQDPEFGPPKNLPEGLTWDEDGAKERWRAFYEVGR